MDMRRKAFDFGRVRGWRTHIQAGALLPLHRHELPRLLHVLQGGILEVRDADGAVIRVHEWQDGESYWLDADPADELHTDFNTGEKEIVVLVCEVSAT